MGVNNYYTGSNGALQNLYAQVGFIQGRARRGGDISKIRTTLETLSQKISQQTNELIFQPNYKEEDLDLLGKLQGVVEKLFKRIQRDSSGPLPPLRQRNNPGIAPIALDAMIALGRDILTCIFSFCSVQELGRLNICMRKDTIHCKPRLAVGEHLFAKRTKGGKSRSRNVERVLQRRLSIKSRLVRLVQLLARIC